MTIDSDGSDVELKKKSNKKNKAPQIIEDEDITINREAHLEEIFDFRAGFQGGSRTNGAGGPKFENKTLWSYKDAVKLD